MNRWTRVGIVAGTAAAAFAGGLLLGTILGVAPRGVEPLPLQTGAASASTQRGWLPDPKPSRRDEADAQGVTVEIPPLAAGAPAVLPTPPAPDRPVAPDWPVAPPLPTAAPTPQTTPPLAEPSTAQPAAQPLPLPAALPPFATASEPRVALSGLRHEWQTWNNCGPATLATLLSYWGSPLTQADIGAVLRHSPDDKNVGPDELAAFAREQGLVARQRVNGDAALLRTLLANGLPVLIESWLEEEPNDGMGHYRLLTGYDDALGGWIAWDSYVSRNLLEGGAKEGGGGSYAGILLPYGEMDALWKVFNRTYLLVYPPQDEALVNAILGAHEAAEEGLPLWQAGERTARAEIAADGADAFAWFNLGSTLWKQGRIEESAAAFDQAITIGLPWRMLWYQFGPFAAYHAVGRAHDALALADKTLATVESVAEVHYWRGLALRALGEETEARAALERALALAPNDLEVRAALLQ